MKKYFFLLLSLGALFFSLTAPVQADPETYTIDPSHSSVLWRINHLGFSNYSGKWMAKGTLVLDEKKPQDSKVNVTIDVADIITGNAELDKHLRDKMFFNTEKFPIATFVSDKIQIINKKTAKLHGTLTLLGVSKPITLDVALNKIGENPITNKMTAGFSATTVIKRSDFGMNALVPALGDTVKIDVEVEANK